MFLFFILVKESKTVSEKIYFKINRQNFISKELSLNFFPKNFAEKKFRLFLKKNTKKKRFLDKKKEFFINLINFLCFQIKKKKKKNFKSNFKFFFKKKNFKNNLFFKKQTILLLHVNFLLADRIFKKANRLVSWFLNFIIFITNDFFSSFIQKKSNKNNLEKNIARSRRSIFFNFCLHFNSLLEISKHYFLILKKKLKVYFDNQLGNCYKPLKLDQINFLVKGSNYYKELLQKRASIEKDKLIIKELIFKLDKKKAKIINQAIKKVNSAFQAIFDILLPSCFAKLVLVLTKKNKTKGIDFRIVLGKNQTQTIEELSGGQKSILALSFMFSLLLNKPAPFYILDEIDAALDLCHTQNIGKMIMLYFPMSQFIIVSLKNGIISNARVIFKIRILQGKSCVIRLQNK